MTKTIGFGSCLAQQFSKASTRHAKVETEKQLETMQDAHSPAVYTLPAVSGKCCTGSRWYAGLCSISSQM